MYVTKWLENTTELLEKTLEENQSREQYEFRRKYSMTDYVHVASRTGVEGGYVELCDDD